MLNLMYMKFYWIQIVFTKYFKKVYRAIWYVICGQTLYKHTQKKLYFMLGRIEKYFKRLNICKLAGPIFKIEE